MTDVDKILELYDSGIGCPTIAAQIGVCVATVAYHVRKHRSSLRKPKRIDWPVEQMRKWYEEDRMTLQEIADRLGQSSKMVNKVAKRSGFRMRPRGQKFGAEHKGWKGGRTVDKRGYVLVYKPEHPHANTSGYIREHRLVMEEKLGRHLLPSEVVHHIDDNTGNNHPDNLELFQTNGEHLAKTRAGMVPNWTEEGKAVLRIALKNATEKRKTIAQNLEELGDSL